MNRRLVALTLLLPFSASIALGDARLRVDVPAAASTVAMPLKVQLLNRAKEPVITIDVDTITVPMTELEKANAIANKINTVQGQKPKYLASVARRHEGAVLNKIYVKVRDIPGIRIEVDPTKEAFEAIGAESDIYEATFHLSASASGFDPSSSPSVVRCGIDRTFVAVVNPTNGMSAASVLSQLAASLNANGVPCRIAGNSLILTNPIPSSIDFVFGNTDTGLDAGAEAVDVSGSAIPTLSGLGVVILTLLLLIAATILLARRTLGAKPA